MERTRIGIIGNGNVGTALSKGLERAGHEVRTVGREPPRVRETAKWAETVILAVPYPERRNAIEEAGQENLDGKTLVDVTNALDGDSRFAGSLERSGAEELQGWAGDGCCVVKAFNTVFAQHMDKGAVGGEPLTLFCAGDDPEAKEEVLHLGDALGFDAVDAGPLENARWLEPLGYLNIQLAFKAGLGSESGFRYVHTGRRRTERPSRGQSERAGHGPEARPAHGQAERAGHGRAAGHGGETETPRTVQERPAGGQGSRAQAEPGAGRGPAEGGAKPQQRL